MLCGCRANTQAPKKNYRYPRQARLRGTELKAVRGAGKRFKAEHLDVRATASMLPYCRVAVVVGKHGHEIVERNRLRRRLRELVRTHLLPECRSIDVVIHARAGAYAAGFTTLANEIDSVRGKLQLTFGES